MVDHFPPERVQETVKYQQQLQENPGDQRAHFELAMQYALTGRVEKGIEELKQLQPTYSVQILSIYVPLSEKEPENSDHKFKLAFAYYFANRKDESKLVFQKILDEDDPKHIWAMAYKALILGEEGNNEAVIELCNRALAVDREAAGVWFLRGEAERRKGDTFKAAADMLKALRLRATDEFKWKQLEREARS